MMAALPYMQLYVADYLADTAHLSTMENGAYLLLIFNYWQRGESFKAKDEQSLNRRLASVTRTSNDEWNSVKDSLSEFFEIDGNEWKHARIERDLLSVNSKSEKAKAAGKASAASKANKRSTNVEQTFNHTDTDTDTDTYKEQSQKNSRAPRFDGLRHLVSKGVEQSVASDWISTRKAKKAAVTESAIKGVEREAGKAGITLASALELCCQRGWAGFKADWISDQPKITGYQSERQARDSAFLAAIGMSAPKQPIEKLIQGDVL